MSAEVVVVGSLGMDLIFRVPRLPRVAETLLGHSFGTAAGGKGGNQAVAAARLGAKVAMVACVGDDDNGRVLLAGLEEDGIDCSAMRTMADDPTGTALILVDDDGNNAIVIVPGAYGRLSPEIVAEHTGLIGRCEIRCLPVGGAGRYGRLDDQACSRGRGQGRAQSRPGAGAVAGRLVRCDRLSDPE